MKRPLLLVCWVCPILLLSSCKVPATGLPAQATVDQNALYTQAVKTIAADLTASIPSTQTVVTATPAPSPTALPAVTATEPQVTATLLVTLTATAQPAMPSLVASDPRLELGVPTFQDTFKDGKNWAFSPDLHSNMEVKDGKVIMTAYNQDFFNSWTLAWPKLTDFYLELTGSINTCAGLDRYGLVFRAPDATQGYLLGLSCDGRYALWYWDGKQEVDLINWTPSAAILRSAGQANRLGVRAQGDHLFIYINGNLVADLHDKTYSQGHFGLFIGGVETANFTAQVSEVAYWDVK